MARKAYGDGMGATGVSFGWSSLAHASTGQGLTLAWACGRVEIFPNGDVGAINEGGHGG